MDISIIIPLWQGADTITECLRALDANSGGFQCETICVDNDSPDGSAALVTDEFPRTKLVRQPVNLGFAGGVNAGINVAQGDLFVLLNQDCIVHPGWLEPLVEAFQTFPACAIAGCTILNTDGSINHAGAYVARPGAYGIHLTEIETPEPAEVDYVTGAAFAIRRAAWETIGPFDENFYPAYYEESDYCYRARQHRYEVRYVPDARIGHLFSGREWQADPVKHASNQHQSRFRFVCKQFNSDELDAFFAAEAMDITEEIYPEQMIGRVEGIRHTLQNLPEIIERRRQDLGLPVSSAFERQMSVGFSGLWRSANDRAIRLVVGAERGPSDAKILFEARRGKVRQLLHDAREARAEARRLRQYQNAVLDRIYFRSPMASAEDESAVARWVRLLIKRPASILSGRDYILRSKLNVLQTMHMEQTEHVEQCLNELLALSLEQLELSLGQLEQMEALADQQQLMRTLADYEYR